MDKVVELGQAIYSKKVLSIYNQKSIFGNAADNLNDLEAALRTHFKHVDIRTEGFSAHV